MAFSFSRRLAEGADRGRASHCITLRPRRHHLRPRPRAEHVLSGFFLFHRAQVRIPGVLQRIGVCFFFADVDLRPLRPARTPSSAAAVLLSRVYWALMMFVPVPGYGTGPAGRRRGTSPPTPRPRGPRQPTPQNTIPGGDPEGLLSSLPAIATTLLGIFAGEWLLENRDWKTKLAGTTRQESKRSPFRSGYSWGTHPFRSTRASGRLPTPC